ncbi:MAG: hypothetical protein ABSA83_20025 [Verrucomicrobiota bacterium]
MNRQTSRIIAIVSMAGLVAGLIGCATNGPFNGTPVPVEGTVRGGSVEGNACDVKSDAYVTFPDAGSPSYTPNPANARVGIVWLAPPYNTSDYKIQWTAKLYPYSGCAKATSSNTYSFSLGNIGNPNQAYMFTAFFTKAPVPPTGSKVTLYYLCQ